MNIPEPHGLPVIISACVFANHAGNVVMRQQLHSRI